MGNDEKGPGPAGSATSTPTKLIFNASTPTRKPVFSATPLSAPPSPVVSKEVTFDTVVVPYLIGKRGYKVQKAMQVSKADICFNTRQSVDGKTFVMISGTEEQVQAAETFLAAQLKDYYMFHTNPDGEVETDDEYQCQVSYPVPPGCHRYFTDKRMHTFEQIERLFDVRFNYQNKDALLIRAKTEEALELALDNVIAVVDQFACVAVPIPRWAIGKIIGHGGEGIRRIFDYVKLKTGSFLLMYIPDTSDVANIMKYCVISSSSHVAVSLALRLLIQMLAAITERAGITATLLPNMAFSVADSVSNGEGSNVLVGCFISKVCADHSVVDGVSTPLLESAAAFRGSTDTEPSQQFRFTHIRRQSGSCLGNYTGGMDQLIPEASPLLYRHTRTSSVLSQKSVTTNSGDDLFTLQYAPSKRLYDPGKSPDGSPRFPVATYDLPSESLVLRETAPRSPALPLSARAEPSTPTRPELLTAERIYFVYSLEASMVRSTETWEVILWSLLGTMANEYLGGGLPLAKLLAVFDVRVSCIPGRAEFMGHNPMFINGLGSLASAISDHSVLCQFCPDAAHTYSSSVLDDAETSYSWFYKLALKVPYQCTKSETLDANGVWHNVMVYHPTSLAHRTTQSADAPEIEPDASRPARAEVRGSCIRFVLHLVGAEDSQADLLLTLRFQPRGVEQLAAPPGTAVRSFMDRFHASFSRVKIHTGIREFLLNGADDSLAEESGDRRKQDIMFWAPLPSVDHANIFVVDERPAHDVCGSVTRGLSAPTEKSKGIPLSSQCLEKTSAIAVLVEQKRKVAGSLVLSSTELSSSFVQPTDSQQNCIVMEPREQNLFSLGEDPSPVGSLARNVAGFLSECLQLLNDQSK